MKYKIFLLFSILLIGCKAIEPIKCEIKCEDKFMYNSSCQLDMGTYQMVSNISDNCTVYLTEIEKEIQYINKTIINETIQYINITPECVCNFSKERELELIRRLNYLEGQQDLYFNDSECNWELNESNKELEECEEELCDDWNSSWC